MDHGRLEYPGIYSHHRAVLALIPLLPFLSGLIMLHPDHRLAMGLANMSIMLLPFTMVAAWPQTHMRLWPGGRIAGLAVIILGFALLLAVTRARHVALSIVGLQFWVGAMMAGRAMQVMGRLYGMPFTRWALIALTIAGPLYALLLPLMHLRYGAPGAIDWTGDMPGFNHVRKMGHLLTLSAAAGLGAILTLPHYCPQSIWARRCMAVLGVLALALALWSGARGAWLALLGATGIALATTLRDTPGAAARAGLALCAATGLALLLPSPGDSLGLWDEIASSAARFNDANALSSDRLHVWANTAALIGHAPLTGYGWGQYPLLQDAYDFAQVHNLPLELLLALGVPMGVLALGVVLALWARAHRDAAQAGPAGIVALMALDTMALYALVSGTYFYGIPVVLSGVAWGICLVGNRPTVK